MSQEAKRILFWSDAGKIEVNYIGLYFPSCKEQQ